MTKLSKCCKAPIVTVQYPDCLVDKCSACNTSSFDKLHGRPVLTDSTPVSNRYCRAVCDRCQDTGYSYYPNRVFCTQCDEGKKLAGTYVDPVVTSTPVSCGKECDTVKYGYGAKEMMGDIIITVAKTQREKALQEAIAVVEKLSYELTESEFAKRIVDELKKLINQSNNV